jgi:fibronectin type 3 domain-containing protein
VSSNASSRLGRAVRSVIELLEERRLLAGDPLAYQNVVQTLPYALDFTQQVNGVFDSTGQSTGFTRVQANTAGNQYQPALLNLNTVAGELDITTTGTSSAGSNYGTDNSQVNALETQFDGTTSGFTIIARLKGPLSYMSAAYDGGGIYFGPDQDNYVKLIAEYDAAKGQTLQFADEQGATTHTVNAYTNIGSFANIATLDLKLTGDAGTGTVTGSYSINGGAWVAMPQSVTLTGTEAAIFFSSASRAGVIASNKNDLPGVTVAFTHFEIDPGGKVADHPTIISTNPGVNASGVTLDTSITADLNLPNSGLNPATVNASNVQLYRTSDHSLVPGVVNTSGGGDSIVLQPAAILGANTQYTFSVSSAVQDTTGVSIVPYAVTFMTGATASIPDPAISFANVDLPTAEGAPFTCVKIGPDQDLYASTEDGRIFRWTINGDGTLGTPRIITSLQSANGGHRLITGFAFDPSATAANPIIWVSNSYYGFDNVPDWTGKITVMSGPDLQTVQDAVIHLPRSFQDHGTEQPTFGPDGALYVAEGSNTAMGAPDSTWGNRPERILSAAILRLDVSKLNVAQGPLDALTSDGGGTYDPFAAGAPLTIYASGVRNAFDLLFTSDGKLYAPTNGSSAGGNTPAFPNNVNGTRIDTGLPYNGPAVPGLTNVPESEIDWLFQIQQGGYYGHPDPSRGEYVLDAGNPTGSTDPNVIPQYPVGTQPDPNYRGYAYDFGLHRSPDGIIQYQDGTFGGKLQGALLVAEYSAGSDIVALIRDANGNVVSTERNIPGFTDLNNPISLIEDTATGNLYVAELGGMKLVLLKPIASHATAAVSKTMLAFNSIAPGNSGAGPSATQLFTITNTGTAALSLSNIGFANDPSVATLDAGSFAITNLGSIPASLAPGQSVTINVRFTAPTTGLHSALLQITTNDAATPLIQLTVRGLGTTGTGGGNEPSLAAILRAYSIPTIVGDGPNDSNGFTSTFYPATPDASSQEVLMPRLVKAGNGPVTITTLAAFAVPNQPALRFGYYVPGDPTDTTQLFTINQSDSQTMSPTAQGATSFDPGSSEFSLYANFPTFTDNGHQRMSYSEDVLNTWDAAVPRKIRFFPLRNGDGSIVPNAYIFAAEDNNIPYGNIQPYDSNDLVGIIYNVQAAPDGAGLGLQNLSGAPSTTRMVFNRIQNLNPYNPSGFVDNVHDKNTLQIQNTGDQPLVITGLNLSDANWAMVNPPALPATVPVGGTLSLTIQFVATTDPAHSGNETNSNATVNGIPVNAAGGVANGTLTILSNDAGRPSRVVNLAGFWQYMSENENEPGMATIANLIYGYGTNIGGGPALPDNGATPVYYGEEVASGYWNVADPTLSVSVRQLAVYHNQFDQTVSPPQPTAAIIGWYPQGSSVRWLFQDQTGEAQSLLPTTNGSLTNPAAGSFSPSGSFGWNIDGENSVDSANTTDIGLGRSGHAVRFFPVRDAAGNLIPNTWIVTMDYEAGSFENGDYQDNVYLVSNMRPAIQAPTPGGAQATGSKAGILVQWQPVSDSTLKGYNIYRSTSINGTYVKLNGSPLSSFTYLDTTASTGVTSYYRITAVDNSGESLGASASAMWIPGAPGNVAASALNSSQIKVSWTASPGASSYDVFREALGDDGFVQVASGITTPSYTDGGLSGGVTYVYQVRASNDVGTSNLSLLATATTPVGGTPAAPSALVATTKDSSQISLTWTDNSNNETSFLIERSTNGTTFMQIASVAAGVTSYTDSGLSSSTAYTYRVRAANTAGNSTYTNTAQATTATPAPTAPAAPSNVLAAVVSSTQINLTWTDNSSGSASFIIVRATGNGGFTQLATVATGLTSYSDTSLSPGTKYTYAVEASSAGGQSDFSNSSSATTPGTPPPPQPGPNNDPGTFDVKLGASGAKTVKFTDADGTIGTIVWSGPGSAMARFTGDRLQQISGRGAVTISGAAGLWEIDATGTTIATSVTITTRGGNNSVDVEGIVSDGAIGKIIAKTSNVTGDINVNGALRQVTAASISGGLLSASSVSALTASHVFADSLAVGSIGTISAGAVDGGTWNVAGGAKSVIAGSVSGVSATFGGTLVSMKVRNSDVNSTIAGTAIGTLDLGGLDSSSRVSPCGITAHTIGTLTGKAHGKRFSLHKLSTASDVSSLLAASGLTASDVLIQME